MQAFARKSGTTANPAFSNKGHEDFFGVQAKLAIGKPNDKYETEADHTADKVVQQLQAKQQNSPFFSPSPAIQAKESGDEQEIQEKPLAESITPLVQKQPEEEIQEKCTECEKEEQLQQKEISYLQREAKVVFPPIPEGVTEKEEKEEGPVVPEEQKNAEKKDKTEAKAPAGGLIELPSIKAEKEKKEKETVQTKSKTVQQSSETESPSADVEGRLNHSKGKGGHLPGTAQQEMGSAFGADFSNVKVHTDSNAVQMNKDLGAQAFTHGNDIYFNEGKYDTKGKTGKHLLAHELTHTIQQGASGTSIQRRFEPSAKKASPEGKPGKPNDGAEVEGKANNKINNDERVQDQDSLSEEEKQEKKDPPRDEVHQEKGATQAEGVSSPSVDRGVEAQEKISEEKEQMEEQLSEEPEAGEGEAKTPENAEDSNMAQADAAAQRALQAEQAARSVQIPERPQPFQHPEVTAPVDSAGEDVPVQGQSAIDTQVRGLGYIGEILREHGYEIKRNAAAQEVHSRGLDATLEKQREDLALAREGTKKIDDQNTERKTISETSKEALEESKHRQEFVATEAPQLAQEAESAKSDSSALASEAKGKADQSKSEVPDDPDARADAEQQSGEMDQTADGAQSMDDAITQTGERARQYEQDAQTAAGDNEQAEASIQETEDTIAQIDTRVAEMDATNEASNASIENAGPGPELIRQNAERSAVTGDEFIAASIVMEEELNALQNEYTQNMTSLESKEDAEKRLREEQQQEQPDISPEEQQVYELYTMSDDEREAQIDQMSDEERAALDSTLDRMISSAPDTGTDAAEGERTQVDVSSVNDVLSYGTLTMGPAEADPRAGQIQQIQERRTNRLEGVLDIADQNMEAVSAEDQRMIANRLVAESITDDIKNISVLQMAKGMLEGMINPVVSLQGVVDGFGKTLTGVANIFNAEAWEKDPLGNLLQIAADISTGMAMVFSSILGIAGAITALMIALVVITWGWALPFATPVIGWMGTVMTYAGWGAIIAGTLSVYYNSLAYIKNVNDAATAETARELFGNTEQMKQNATDGFQGAMAVVEGVGAVKMGPNMSSQRFLDDIPTSPGELARNTLRGARNNISNIASLPARAARGAQQFMRAGKKGLRAFKGKIQGFLRRRGGPGPDLDTPNTRQRRQDTLDNNRNRSLDEMTPEQRRIDLGETANHQPRRIDPDSEFHARYDVEIESNGHTYRRNRDGSGWCRFSSKECGIPENDLPQSVRDNIENITPTRATGPKTKRQRDFETEIQRRLDAGEIDGPQAQGLRDYNEANPSGSRNVDQVLEDVNNPHLELNPETGRFHRPVERVQGTPRADLPEPGSPAHQKWQDYLEGRSNVPCFPEGTLVATPNGMKAIETIAINDYIWSYDHLNNEVKLEIVTDLFTNWACYMVDIQLENSLISATLNHPFWEEEEKKYIRADELTPGMKLRSRENKVVEIIAVNQVLTQQVTYNLEAGELHNYFVGKDQVLVHNDEAGVATPSGFASTTAHKSTVYVISDSNGKVVYVGQTVQNFDDRFLQHLTDSNSSVYKYLERELGAGFSELEARRHLRTQTPVDGVELTHYELSVMEQHHIDRHGGIDSLENKINAITPEKQQMYADLHNPCQ